MKTIHLDGEESLRIFSLPLRQRILREMQKAGRPVTAKQIADRLAITPSSAQHHMKRLESIGLIEPDHIESINGIQARFMRAADVMVSIGQQQKDENSMARDALMKSHLLDAYDGFQRVVEYARENPQPQQHRESGNDIFTEIAHLTEEEARELRALVMEYAQRHKNAGPGTHPWQIVYMAYDMELAERKGKA
jgi:DNA-binding transcriptional ArsR family regulator